MAERNKTIDDNKLMNHRASKLQLIIFSAEFNIHTLNNIDHNKYTGEIELHVDNNFI